VALIGERSPTTKCSPLLAIVFDGVRHTITGIEFLADSDLIALCILTVAIEETSADNNATITSFTNRISERA
jgi:hypothetical protein